MSYTIRQDSGNFPPADAAVLCTEITMDISDIPSSRRLCDAGGNALREALRTIRFLPAGSACAIDGCGLPYANIILTSPPRWLNGKMNELLVLHRCYESVFETARELGTGSLVLPFLSTQYYRFPQAEAVHIALCEAEKSPLEAIFLTDSEALFELTQTPYRKPAIVSYIGYYRDHAVFALDNGLFARVDLRPEITDAAVIPYFEACYRVGNNPLQTPLAEAEIARLRAIYEDFDWC